MESVDLCAQIRQVYECDVTEQQAKSPKEDWPLRGVPTWHNKRSLIVFQTAVS